MQDCIDGTAIPSTGNVTVFRQAAATGEFIPYHIPVGATMLYMYTLGGAGGGGGGKSTASTNNGGGGGGAGGRSRAVIYPTAALPATLFVRVGAGGVGGGAASNGTAGTTTLISDRPNTQAANCICGEAGGNGGTGATTSSGGAAGSIQSSLTNGRNVMGIFASYSPVAAAAGGNSTNPGVAVTMTPGPGGGAGGGGANSANTNQLGGAVTTASADSIIPETLVGGTIPGGAGNHGWTVEKYWIGCPGSGGGSQNASGVGGRGGDGGIGCGGGGGGAGATGGAGGKGGNGLAIIIAW